MKSIAELEKELGKLNEDLTLAKESEQLQTLSEKQVGMKGEIEKLLSAGKPTEELEGELKALNENLWLAESKVKVLKGGRDERTEKIREEIKSRKRQASETFASATLGRIEGLRKELAREAKGLFCAVELWMNNRTYKWNQCSSRKFVWVEKEVPAPGNVSTVEKNYIELYKLKAAEAAGWKLLPGQDLTPEPVDGRVAIPIQAHPTPDAIQRAASLDIAINGSTFAVSDQDLAKFEKGALKEI
jgi:hypothetical protein